MCSPEVAAPVEGATHVATRSSDRTPGSAARRVVGRGPRPRRLGRSLVLVTAGAALLVACSKGGEPTAAGPGVGSTPTEPAAVASSTTTAAPVPTYPLTGLPVDDPGQAAQPALVIKIDNVNDMSRPQAGINQADLVYEEKIEGPISRFAAVFHSHEVGDVGPIRSGRSTDVAIVSTLNHPLYVFSGANEVFAKKLREAPLVYLDYDHNTALFDRRANRKAPDNVFTSTARLRAKTPEGQVPPEPAFVYRKAGEQPPADAVAMGSFTYNWGGGPVDQPVIFTWDATRQAWARQQKGSPHVDVDGNQIAPANVIVQFVPYVDTGLVDLSKTPVPEAKLVGEGGAWVFTDGKAVKATWSKPDLPTRTTFTGADGQPIALTPGQTWIALVPDAGDRFSGTTASGQSLT